MQAESEQDKREWVHALQTVTANLLGISVPHAPMGHKSSVDVGRESIHEMGSGMSLKSQVPVRHTGIVFFFIFFFKKRFLRG